MNKILMKHWIAASTLAFAGAMPASAALVTLRGALSGANFDVAYDDSLLGAYGTPVLSDNVLSFAPSTFSASAGPGGFDLLSQSVSFTIALHDGYRINSVSVNEGGLYDTWGNGSFVAVGGQLTAYDVAQPPGISQALTASDLSVGGTAPTFTYKKWSATASANLASFTTAEDVNVNLLNSLVAVGAPSNGDPTLAVINKSFVSVAVNVSPVPEAETWAMMLVGVGLVGFRLRHRSKKVAAHRLV